MKNNFILQTPVLFIIFNRLDTTKQVFQEIRKAKPKQLFIAADGPRTKEEKKKTDAVRKYILDNIDWECNVNTLFSDLNNGCGIGPYKGISWFFENVEQGIILEDDCLPSQSFFHFCDKMLKKYKKNKDIVQISGTNFLENESSSKSYIFSKYCASWGWATWARCWKNFDLNLSQYKTFREIKFKQRLWLFDKILKWTYFSFVKKIKKIHFWDYQWNIYRSIVGRLNIIPKISLVENIGFGEDATHTRRSISNVGRNNLKFPLIHPKKVISNKSYDQRFYRERIIPQALKNLIKVMINKDP